ncbi:MAG: hypothetical protein J0652_03445 [Desulfobulbaceae bacterium]|jgi:hypothetical protein|nr:hypothetical protein [Desulfobulbaceae bacterium]
MLGSLCSLLAGTQGYGRTSTTEHISQPQQIVKIHPSNMADPKQLDAFIKEKKIETNGTAKHAALSF